MSRDQFESDIAGNIGVLTIDIAANTAPAQHTELLDFISRLQKVTVTDPGTGEKVKCENFRYLWTDLPSLGMHAADNCNFCMDPCLSAALHYVFPLTHTVNHRSHTPDELSKWENKIAFIAQSTAAAEITYNSEPTHTMDFSLYRLYACRDA